MAEVLKVVEGVRPEMSLTAKEILKKGKLKFKNISEVLHRMMITNRIARISSGPYRYFDIQFDPNFIKDGPAEKNGLMACAMRNDREIEKQVCVPNPEAPQCNVCQWGNK
ncbi:hypothetical protein KAR91_31165 [Candidatus Pacearchaeota archaeon]|nr:hypothetical protein [Candidatus Pacearchaeota archaeon]